MIPSIEAKRKPLSELCAQYQVRSLEVFGSAATGNIHGDSDLDFLVDFHPADSMSPADQYFGLLEALEELFGRKVDLLTKRSLRNPYFIDSVEQTRQLLYAA